MVALVAPVQSIPRATLAGLFLALIVPTLGRFIEPIFFGTAQTSARIGWGIVAHCANLAALIAVVMLAERQRPSSMGLRPLRWWTVPLGLLAGLAILVLSGFLVNAMRASSEPQLAVFLQSLPFTTRVLVVITAGIFEETLYRGYALERLASAFKSKWAAGGVTLVFFTLAHLPAVGLVQLLPVFIVGLFITLLYLWRRDIVVNIVAHATIDGVSLLLIPILAHYGT